MAGEGIAAQQMLQQQAALEQRNAAMQNMMKQQAASQIMRQIAASEIQREMAMEAQTGRALESAAGSQDRRDVGKSRMETQKELEEKQRLLGLIGGAAEAAGALGGYLQSQNALKEAQFKGRVEKAALNPQVDDMSQFNPDDLAALRAMSDEQTFAEAKAAEFDEGAVNREIRDIEGMLEMERMRQAEAGIASEALRPRQLDQFSGYDFDPDWRQSLRGASIDASYPRSASAYEEAVIQGMVDPQRGMPLSVEGRQTNEALERKNRRIREQLRAIRAIQGDVGSAPINPYSE